MEVWPLPATNVLTHVGVVCWKEDDEKKERRKLVLMQFHSIECKIFVALALLEVQYHRLMKAAQ